MAQWEHLTDPAENAEQNGDEHWLLVTVGRIHLCWNLLAARPGEMCHKVAVLTVSSRRDVGIWVALKYPGSYKFISAS